MYPYNHKMGQKIQTDSPGVSVDRAFLAHYKIDAADAPAASTTSVLEFTNLGSAAQAITEGITSPKVPRNLQIDGNVSGITGKVKITGTNFADEVITEEIQTNGTTAKEGNRAFKTITKIDLPAQNHTPAAQTETIQVTLGCSTAGDLTVAVTAKVLGDDSPVSVTVAVTTDDDTAAKVATKIVDGLNADDEIAVVFTASVTGAGNDTITLTANAPDANDDTLAMAVTAGSTGVTVGASTNGTAGVPYDQISVGWGDIFGLPYMLPFNTVIAAFLGGTADSLTVVTDANEIEKNTFDMTGSADGEKAIDVYLIV